MATNGRILILGAGHAGGTCAALLRQQGWTGPITLAGDESIAPYQRPPLSKGWLKGEVDAEALALRPDAFYAKHDIELRLGRRAVAIVRGGHGGVVSFENGDVQAYDKLVLATGARARRAQIPGAELDGVLSLRTVADAAVLKAALQPGMRLAVIGGGYVGLEAAASARALGIEVTVFELQPRLLARVAHEVPSAFIHEYHLARGVKFELPVHISAFEGNAGRLAALQCASGKRSACDLALVGIGAVPNQELADAAGLDCRNGVVVDLAARTSDPNIYAIGDCTQRPLPLYGVELRLESVPSALEQARQAGVSSALDSPFCRAASPIRSRRPE